jgi:sugar O-acyltransferase (sialic acid O-acetyltransferase NeuD family)
MLIAGAGGHAIETLDVLLEYTPKETIGFFDDVTDVQSIHDFFPVLKNQQEVEKWFAHNNHFCLGVGNTNIRKKLCEELNSYGGELVGIRSVSATLSSFSRVDKGVDICKLVFVSSLSEVGSGTLVNTGAKIYHHVTVGRFCEISPGVTLLGGATIGDECTIGTGVIVLSKISVCSNTILGAGAVVVNNITTPGTYVGIPARKIK